MSNWHNCRIKDAVNLVSVKTEDFSLPYIALDNIVSWDAQFIPSESESDGNSNECQPGDVLFGKLRPYLAKAYIPTERSICSPEFLVMRPNNGTHNKFMLYYLLSKSFIAYIKNQVAGTKMPRTKWTDLGSVSFSLPPLAEQEAIAEYLDKECEKIGREIELLERKADAYRRLRRSIINRAVTRGLNPNAPMKPTIFGDMPSHWVKYRLKDLYTIYGGLSGKSKEDFLIDEDNSEAKPFIKYTNILNNFIITPNNHGYVRISSNELQNKVSKNDLLILMSSEDYVSIGLTSLVNQDLGEVYLNSFCKGLRPNNESLNSKFIAYQLRADRIHDLLRNEARGFTRINLKIDKVICHSVCLPPYTEQQEIVAYLDEKCGKIDGIVEKIGVKIERLKELKRSLINEVVAGRRPITK